MPLEPVSEVRVEPSWWRALRIGTPGRHFRFRPGRWCAGELVHARGRDFVALTEGEPVLVVDFRPGQSPYARVALSVDDPHGLAAALRRLSTEWRDSTEKRRGAQKLRSPGKPTGTGPSRGPAPGGPAAGDARAPGEEPVTAAPERAGADGLVTVG
ncbi:hypothetical protein [Streptomyces sp. NBC_00557]|uniref:hypothetical protein n=1 Tax=Streptomyces sp. NBC_00557 TaxID=2975776 RepID=UPI002E817B4D|nr:hypothetical protein [Streptomyces sp. NBC_00557]WUC33982.1 hypothetical protein OG956_07085 [Streptomyces sp. NBC_00557]